MNKLYLVILILLFGCNQPNNHEKLGQAQAATKATPLKETVMDGIKRPWSMAFLSENEVLVAEKDGDLLRVDLTTKEKTVIQGFPEDLFDSIKYESALFRSGTFPRDVPDGTFIKFNAGIFQVLLDPDFDNNKLLYVSYAAKGEGGTTTKVIRAALRNNSLSEVQTLLLALPYSDGLFHFGGGMTFGKDGKLYVTIGERLFSESHEPEMPIAQDLSDRRGKIYRINPDGTIPEDNPDFGEGAIPGLYAIGIRASQGMTLEPKTGKIWFSEHGTVQGDEINILESGANYGWPIITTGKYRGPGYTPPTLDDASFKDPTWYWLQTVAPTGLTFYTGDEFPQWKNNLIVPGLSRGSLWRFNIEGEIVKSVEELFVDSRVRLRKAVQSPEGKLYVLTDEVNGRILRVKNANTK